MAAATTEIEFMVFDLNGAGPRVRPQLQIHNRHTLKSEADMAKQMAMTGMVAGIHDNETMKLLTPDEVVQRACDIAQLAYAEFARRGWLVPLPSHQEMTDDLLGDRSNGPGFGR
jgi:hypothetical protein